MPEVRRRDGVLQVAAPGAEWLSTGWAGGRRSADAAYNVSVPGGFDRTDLDAYVDERTTDAAFETTGPALLTGVAMDHARCARAPIGGEADAGETPGDADLWADTALAVATAGVSNPAPLFPVNGAAAAQSGDDDSASPTQDDRPLGTVNVLVYVDRPLTEGALANLVAVAAEAKAATLGRETGFPGTTTDAVIVGCPAVIDPAAGDAPADAARFSGSGTPVGVAARACARDAVRASLGSRYVDQPTPETAAAAEHGVSPPRATEVLEP
jgi:adenosylcobinamide hydrolase